ncbi:MAG TPA: glycerol-3-phosphate 1-O-acyltransferase PlsY [Erysipelotrichaceae bacterium]|nr:glycerol-3-phosphate 1-O-acyltransferase PlsY [Erysipelotrichaceae bacterium]HQB32972.1 glycerol-3-phosphate 1-O-acyltransferase PlsY [Erysipelotrichaceae bacterium]
MKLIIFAILNYIVGSVPWALVIGKVFYNTDVRKHGSGNLGATNTGRTLGKKAAYAVAIMDALKGFFMFLILSGFDYEAACLTSIFVPLGHCYPLFANFKGGKAVATTFGIILAVSIHSLKSFLLVFLLPVAIWFLISKVTEYVSLASLVSTLLSVIISFFVCQRYVTFALLAIWILIVYKHKDNIERLLKGTENKKNY